MHSPPQFTRSTLLGKFTWVRAIISRGKFYRGGNFPGGGQFSSWAIFLEPHKSIHLKKALYRFFDFISRKYFTMNLKMTILISCLGKFCYRHENFQNTEAATGGVLKSSQENRLYVIIMLLETL